MNHKYLLEVFPEDEVPFPFGKKDYHAFDERDTFSLHCTFIYWLYECLRYFQEEASKMVDFNWHKFEINGEEFTQAQCIQRMIDDCKIIMLGNDWEADEFQKMNAAKEDLFMVLDKVFWAMWW